jgi:renalase
MHTTHSLRIAVQGSGVAAAAVAERLCKRHEVTVFEAGRGPGGRMSTRRAGAYQWDHGAQYFSPKTEAFENAVDEWCARGLSEIWEGRHCVWTANGGVLADPKAAAAKRYVGSPGMNEICRGMLEGVKTIYETRAVAKRHADGMGWTLKHGKSGKPLGDFDFLICSDKTAATHYRSDLDKGLLGGFVKPACGVRSARSLALLLATNATKLEFNSLLLEEHPAFSWIARDDTKPGRQRTDGAECWVAHASPAFTTRFLDTQKGQYANAIRANVVRDLVPQFAALVSDINGGFAPEVVQAQGHRWGAAFPTASFDPSVGTQFYLDADAGFAACGDYFTPFPGRVEGAWISGSSLANTLLQLFSDLGV